MNGMKKAVKFDWSEDMKKNFKELKSEFKARSFLRIVFFNY